jgi:hypothetical protein
MNVKRAVADIDVLSLELLMDLGWIATFGSHEASKLVLPLTAALARSPLIFRSKSMMSMLHLSA